MLKNSKGKRTYLTLQIQLMIGWPKFMLVIRETINL